MNHNGLHEFDAQQVGPTEQLLGVASLALGEVSGEAGEQGPQTIEDLEQRYGNRKAAVDELREDVSAYEQPSEHPSHMSADPGHKGHGYYKHAHHLDGVVSDAGKPLIAKIYKEQDAVFRTRNLRRDAEALLQVRGLGTFEQIDSASREDGVLISEQLDAHTIERASDDDLAEVTEENIDLVFADLLIASDRSVVLDRNPGNVLIGGGKIHLIDPEKISGTIYYPLDSIRTLALAIAGAGSEASGTSAAARIRTLEMLGSCVRATFSDPDNDFHLRLHEAVGGVIEGIEKGKR